MRQAVNVFTGYKVTPGNAEEETAPEVRGKYGSITPFDENTLAVYVEGVRKFKKLAEADGAVVFTEGEGEGTIHLPNGLMELAAKVIEAKKKRAVSPANRERLQTLSREHSPFRKNPS